MHNRQDTDQPSYLSRMGWTSHFQEQLDPRANDNETPFRVIGVRKNRFRAGNGHTERLATLAGRLIFNENAPHPVTGDWVLMTDTVITRVLARTNTLSRGASGTRDKPDAAVEKEQVIAANLDFVWIVCGLDRDFNLRRIERYLTLVYNCGLTPVIVLTKADRHDDPDRFAVEAAAVAFGVPIHLVSAGDDTSLAPLASYISPGRTTTLVGSSGAGKSTLVNRLSGRSVQTTRPVSEQVGKGRHTTTTRDLFMMPQGGMIIDNPGIREIAFWEVDEGMESAFPDIEAMGAACRFADCTHTHEPGCRVLGAVEKNEISEDRLENYRKMKREMDYAAQRRRKSADRLEKERWKKVSQKIRAMNKGK